MNNEEVVSAVILVLKNANFNNLDILNRQSLAARDLIDSMMLDNAEVQGVKCEHPKDARRNLSSMGDAEKTEQCLVCGEIIKTSWE